MPSCGKHNTYLKFVWYAVTEIPTHSKSVLWFTTKLVINISMEFSIYKIVAYFFKMIFKIVLNLKNFFNVFKFFKNDLWKVITNCVCLQKIKLSSPKLDILHPFIVLTHSLILNLKQCSGYFPCFHCPKPFPILSLSLKILYWYCYIRHQTNV